MYTMGVRGSSCGSLEVIVQVGGCPEIAVLARQHDAWTSTTWSIFHMPCCLKMLPKVSNSTEEHQIFEAYQKERKLKK